MRKLIYILGLVVFVTLFTSCKKENAAKDVENTIIKLNIFNDKFQELYSDGQIIKDGEESEYETLKTLAADYYESINKINTLIEEESSEGVDEYEKEYKKVVAEKKSEIDKATAKFIENLNKIN